MAVTGEQCIYVCTHTHTYMYTHTHTVRRNLNTFVSRYTYIHTYIHTVYEYTV